MFYSSLSYRVERKRNKKIRITTPFLHPQNLYFICKKFHYRITIYYIYTNLSILNGSLSKKKISSMDLYSSELFIWWAILTLFSWKYLLALAQKQPTLDPTNILPWSTSWWKTGRKANHIILFFLYSSWNKKINTH